MNVSTRKTVNRVGVGSAALLVWALVGVSMPVFAQNYSEGGRPSITVEFDNELVTLARGYEAAFRKLPAGPRFAVVKTPEGPVSLEDSIREVEAIGGVVILRMQKGVVHAMSASDIVKLTNENPRRKR